MEYRKLIRILVYPNITYQKDIEKDSYIQVIKNQITLLNSIRDDLWFHLILPFEVPSLQPNLISRNFENVSQYVFPLPTLPTTMRSHFDVNLMQKILSKDLDFDLIMSHLPEHTHQLVNTMYNLTHHSPKVFGYCHWFDLKGVVASSKDSFIQNITGLLEYDRCYLNTEHQKGLVLNQSKKTFNDNVISKLDKILQVQHLGVVETDIVEKINENPEKIIVFNHRPDAYKNYKLFLRVIDELRKIRQDFKVWVPLSTSPDRNYFTAANPTFKDDKNWYYNELKKCCVGFSPKQKYGGWSIATTDGMMNGVPYIMFNDTYYKELCPNADFFDDTGAAVKLLDKYLSDSDYRNHKSNVCRDWISKNLIYKNEMIKMSKYMDDLLERTSSVPDDNDVIKKIIEWIKTEETMSKSALIKKLRWGTGFGWTPYRRTLMKHPNIHETKQGMPIYHWID